MRARLAAAVVGALMLSGQAAAQVTVDLQVLNARDGEPVRNVVVRIPERGTYVLTDSLGRASIQDLEVGAYRLMLTRMGFEPLSGDFTVRHSGDFRISLLPVLVSASAEPGEVTGRVIDPQTGEGVAGASVTVAGALRRVTDGKGWFTVELVPAGAHAIEVEFLGRRTIRDSVFVSARETLEVSVHLPIEAIELEGITVTAHSRLLTWAGFFRRQREAPAFRGRQWTAGELEAEDPASLEYVLTEVTGIRPPVQGAGKSADRRFLASRGCPLSVYVDGFEMDPWFDLYHIDPRRVAALELWHGSNLPFPYQVNGCGVILVWMKRR